MDGTGICQSSLLSESSTLKQDKIYMPSTERGRECVRHCQIAAKYDTLPTPCQ